jgi:hypothetical protein
MKKIVIISFYELKDYLLYIKELFEDYLFTVIHYPLFRYAYDSNDKLETYKEHMNTFIKEQNPDIVLWWFIDVPVDVFKYIKKNNKEKIFIMYNADDPVNLNKELFDKAKIFDIVVSPCKETIYLYKLYSNLDKIIFGPMGHDPNLFKQLEDIDEPYKCDISMVIYNIINKTKIIEKIVDICNKNNYIFKLYGNPILNELYPNNYCGEVPYYKLNFMINSSKINIIYNQFTHKSLCIDEYLTSILGCGALLLHNKTKDIDKILIDGSNCILYDEDNIEVKINMIMHDYNYDDVKSRAHESSEKYTWDKWVLNIVREVGKLTFNENTYMDLYDISENALDHWSNKGIYEKKICFDFDIPNSFNSNDYISKKNIKNNLKYAYFHWFVNSQDGIYMKKTHCEMDFNVDDYNIVMEDYFNICNALNKIGKYDTKDDGLIELNNICNQIPNIKINDIIEKYMDSI